MSNNATINHTSLVEEQIIDKLLILFGGWCDDYKSGLVKATPRYCQLDLKSINSDNTTLYSTIHGYGLLMTDDFFTVKEWDWIKDKFHYIPKLDIAEDSEYVWNWWKTIRTKHLREHYPTINSGY